MKAAMLSSMLLFAVLACGLYATTDQRSQSNVNRIAVGLRIKHVIVEATLDIYPDTLNLKSRGKWITVYIQLPEDHNAANINATTILLNETIQPVLDPKYGFVTDPSGYLVDHNNDGILERMVKFDRAMVQSFIYSQGIKYGNVGLAITGKMLDGTPFEGTDVIIVNHAGDVNNDGIVNIFDILEVKNSWETTPNSPNWIPECDINNDGIINTFDILAVRSNWGQTTP